MDTKEKKRPAPGGNSKQPAASGKPKAAASGKPKTASGGKRGAAASKAGPSGSRRTAPTKKKPAGPKASAPVYRGKRPRPERQSDRKRNTRPAPEVVYTQPDPFNRNRFLLRLLTVVAVVLALFFGMSIFFKVEKIMVSGADKYTAWEVRQASGIEDGENLLTLNEAMIGGRIKTALPYVSRVRVGIKLPDTVNIEIEEIRVTYAVESFRNGWWLITADGKIMESVNSVDAGDYTKLTGFWIESPVIGGQAIAYEPEPKEPQPSGTEATGTTGTTEPVTFRTAEQLNAALDIAQYLEDKGVLGAADEINVADMTQLEIRYGDQYQILLGDTTRLGYKIEMMKNTIDQLGDHYSGILDVSYTLRPDQVVYTPFN